MLVINVIVGMQDYLCKVDDTYIRAVRMEIGHQDSSLLPNETIQLFQRISNTNSPLLSFDTAVHVFCILMNFMESL